MTELFVSIKEAHVMTDQPISQATSEDITSDDKLWGLLSYIFTPLVPLIVLLMEDKKNRPFLRYHAIQSLAFGVVMMITYVVVIGCCLSPVYLVGAIYFGIKAYNGEYVTIPFLTDFCKQQQWL
jgi:uncharacterized membrane protein